MGVLGRIALGTGTDFVSGPVVWSTGSFKGIDFILHA